MRIEIEIATIERQSPLSPYGLQWTTITSQLRVGSYINRTACCDVMLHQSGIFFIRLVFCINYFYFILLSKDEYRHCPHSTDHFLVKVLVLVC